MHYLVQITGTNVWIQQNDGNGNILKKNTMYPNMTVDAYSGPHSDRLQMRESIQAKQLVFDAPMSLCVIDYGMNGRSM